MTVFNPASLARATVEIYVKNGRTIEIPDDLPEKFKRKSGVFVSIKIGTELRGCMGTSEPCTENIGAEIIRNAVCAAARDPRFRPITPDELDKLSFSVDVLSPNEAVDSLDDLDPRVYGVIVESGLSRGLLLPNLEGVTTAATQVAIAKQKAGIAPDAKVDIYRFSVERFLEDE